MLLVRSTKLLIRSISRMLYCSVSTLEQHVERSGDKNHSLRNVERSGTFGDFVERLRYNVACVDDVATKSRSTCRQRRPAFTQQHIGSIALQNFLYVITIFVYSSVCLFVCHEREVSSTGDSYSCDSYVVFESLSLLVSENVSFFEIRHGSPLTPHLV